MKLISHRGNINGRKPELENRQEYIIQAINSGYDVEIDIWYDKELWLGHDEPQYKVSLDFLKKYKDKLWIHCKNFKALSFLIEEKELNIFYHKTEEYTILSNNLIWAHNLQEVDIKCIIPLLSKYDIDTWIPSEVYGICSDYVNLLEKQ